ASGRLAGGARRDVPHEPEPQGAVRHRLARVPLFGRAQEGDGRVPGADGAAGRSLEGAAAVADVAQRGAAPESRLTREAASLSGLRPGTEASAIANATSANCSASTGARVHGLHAAPERLTSGKTTEESPCPDACSPPLCSPAPCRPSPRR